MERDRKKTYKKFPKVFSENRKWTKKMSKIE